MSLTVDGYQIIEPPIGEGGMARVYAAVKDHKKIAIKALHPEAMMDRNAVERFKREFEIGVTMQGNPAFAQMFKLCETNHGLAIVMEFISGETLHDILKKTGKFKQEEAIAYIFELAKALAPFHQLNFVHRDLKPENIMVKKSDGQIKIMDYGATRDLNFQLTQTGSTLGTPIYMSPEQICGSQSIDCRCDIYSLGLIFNRLLTGKDPHQSDNSFDFMKLFKLRSQSPYVTVEGIDDTAILKILNKCLEANPQKRYSNTEDLCKDLKKLKNFPDSKKTIIKTIRTDFG